MSKAAEEVPAKVAPAEGPSPGEEAKVHETEPGGPRGPHQHLSAALLPSLGNQALEEVGQSPYPYHYTHSWADPSRIKVTP